MTPRGLVLYDDVSKKPNDYIIKIGDDRFLLNVFTLITEVSRFSGYRYISAYFMTLHYTTLNMQVAGTSETSI